MDIGTGNPQCGTLEMGIWYSGDFSSIDLHDAHIFFKIYGKEAGEAWQNVLFHTDIGKERSL